MPHRWRGDETVDTQCFFTNITQTLRIFSELLRKKRYAIFTQTLRKYNYARYGFLRRRKNYAKLQILRINYANRLRKICRYYANTCTQSLRNHLSFTQLYYADISQELRNINYAIITHITQSLCK